MDRKVDVTRPPPYRKGMPPMNRGIDKHFFHVYNVYYVIVLAYSIPEFEQLEKELETLTQSLCDEVAMNNALSSVSQPHPMITTPPHLPLKGTLCPELCQSHTVGVCQPQTAGVNPHDTNPSVIPVVKCESQEASPHPVTSILTVTEDTDHRCN